MYLHSYMGIVIFINSSKILIGLPVRTNEFLVVYRFSIQYDLAVKFYVRIYTPIYTTYIIIIYICVHI